MEGFFIRVVARPAEVEVHVDDFLIHSPKVKPVVQVLGAMMHWSGYGPNTA